MGRAKPIKRRSFRRPPPREMELITTDEMSEFVLAFSVYNSIKESEKEHQPYVEVDNDNHRYGEWKLPEGTKSSLERAHEIVRELNNCPYPSYLQPPRPRVHQGPFTNVKPVVFTRERPIFDDVKDKIEAMSKAAKDLAAGIEPPCEGAVGYDPEHYEASMMFEVFKIDRSLCSAPPSLFYPFCLRELLGDNLPPSKPRKPFQGNKKIRNRRYAARNVDTGPVLCSSYWPTEKHTNIASYSGYNSEYEELYQQSKGHRAGSPFNKAEVDTLSMQDSSSPSLRSHPSWASDDMSWEEI